MVPAITVALPWATQERRRRRRRRRRKRKRRRRMTTRMIDRRWRIVRKKSKC
jgi:hypothetical protein